MRSFYVGAGVLYLLCNVPAPVVATPTKQPSESPTEQPSASPTNFPTGMVYKAKQYCSPLTDSTGIYEYCILEGANLNNPLDASTYYTDCLSSYFQGENLACAVIIAYEELCIEYLQNTWIINTIEYLQNDDQNPNITISSLPSIVFNGTCYGVTTTATTITPTVRQQNLKPDTAESDGLSNRNTIIIVAVIGGSVVLLGSLIIVYIRQMRRIGYSYSPQKNQFSLFG